MSSKQLPWLYTICVLDSNSYTIGIMATRGQPYHKKRYGHHQKKTAHFLKAYYPYIPLLSIVIAIFFVAFGMPVVKQGVLSYATNVDTASLLDETNQQRSANHERLFTLNEKLNQAAQAKANDMVARNYWSHNTPDGNPPWTFIDKVGYQYQKAGENLAYGFTSSAGTVRGWMNSPTHRENLLDTTFTQAGFGFANSPNYQNQGNETIVVALYAAPNQLQLTDSLPAGITLTNSPPTGLSTLGATTQAQPEPRTSNITFAQLLSNRRLPWLNTLLVLAAGVSLGIILVRHGLKLKRVVAKTEHFALTHPLFDVTLISLFVLCVLLIRSAGAIR